MKVLFSAFPPFTVSSVFLPANSPKNVFSLALIGLIWKAPVEDVCSFSFSFPDISKRITSSSEDSSTCIFVSSSVSRIIVGLATAGKSVSITLPLPLTASTLATVPELLPWP